MGKFLGIKGKQLCSKYSAVARFQTHPKFYACPGYLQVS